MAIVKGNEFEGNVSCSGYAGTLSMDCAADGRFSISAAQSDTSTRGGGGVLAVYTKMADRLSRAPRA